MTTSNLRRLSCFCLAIILALAALPAGALAQADYDRIVRNADLSVVPDPGGEGWTISARTWIANHSSGPLELGGILRLSVNGVTVGSTSESMLVLAEGGGSCIASCAAQPGCTACIPSPIPPLACFCCNRFIDASATLSSLSAGDVVAAVISPLPGSAPESITQDDFAVFIVPHAVAHNRVVRADRVTYGRSTIDAGYAVSGEVLLETNPGPPVDLSWVVTVYVGGAVVGGGPGGSCGNGGGTTQKIIIGYGFPGGSIPNGPILYNCTQFCVQQCVGGDVNICHPPIGIETPSPICICDTFCIPFRIGHFSVPVAQLGPEDIITVAVSPFPGSLPEIDPADDQVSVTAAAIASCPVDVNHDGAVAPADVAEFVGAWFQSLQRGSSEGDFNLSGTVTPADVASFIGLWFDVVANGC